MYFALFLPVLSVLFIIITHLEVQCVYVSVHIQTKTDTGPIFSALEYRCVGSSQLGPQMEQKGSVCVCVSVCVDVCLCTIGLRSKLKVGV